MLYTTVNFGGKVLNLRLTTRNLKLMKAQINTSPLKIIQGLSSEPDITELLSIIHYASKANHSELTEDDIFELYDNFIDNGCGAEELMALCFEVMRVSGICQSIPREMAEILKKLNIEVPTDKIIDVKNV